MWSLTPPSPPVLCPEARPADGPVVLSYRQCLGLGRDQEEEHRHPGALAQGAWASSSSSRMTRWLQGVARGRGARPVLRGVSCTVLLACLLSREPRRHCAAPHHAGITWASRCSTHRLPGGVQGCGAEPTDHTLLSRACSPDCWSVVTQGRQRSMQVPKGAPAGCWSCYRHLTSTASHSGLALHLLPQCPSVKSLVTLCPGGKPQAYHLLLCTLGS